jgi:integrase
MAALRKKLKISDKIVAYSYRHTYVTDALIGGENLATIAAVVGHTNTSMVAKVYGHLEGKNDALAASVNRIAKRRSES